MQRAYAEDRDNENAVILDQHDIFMPQTWSRTNIAPMEKNNIVFNLSDNLSFNHMIGQNGRIRIATSSTSPDASRTTYDMISASQLPRISGFQAAAGGWQTRKIATIVANPWRKQTVVKHQMHGRYRDRVGQNRLIDNRTEIRISVLITHHMISFANSDFERYQSHP